MKLPNGYEIPEGMESMSCINNCGFVLLWSVGRSEGVGERMDIHLDSCEDKPKRTTFRTKGV